MNLEGHLYDGEGNEIILKPGHVMVVGSHSFMQVPLPESESFELVYREPSEEMKKSEKYQKIKEMFGE